MEGLYHDIINKELSDTFSSIDQLTLSYDGSRLKKVSDSASALTYEGAMDFRDGANKVTEYTWDANGRMASDANRGIYKIEYNELNLPREVKFNDGHVTRYTYAADGRKLRVTYLMTNSHVIDVLGPLGGAAAELNGGPVIEPQFPGDSLISPIGSTRTLMTIDNSGNHIYRNDTMSLVLNDYGYLTADGLWRYHIKDWQGNVRAVIDDQGSLLEINNYYPYGMLMGQATAGEQPYKYGGKELERMFGLDSQDFGARWYQPSLGLWHTPDSYCEDTPWLSPYSYCAANPVNLIDPTGNYWIKAKYDKTSFYYYDSRILTEDDIAKYYGDETDLSFAGQSITIEVLDAETRKMLDSFKLKDDGTFLMNGTELDTEYNRNNSLIIGSDCFLAKDRNGNIVYPNNWYGNYLGPNNPMTGTSQYIYAVPPIDRLDYAAFNHDRNYDKQGAVSYIGVINPLTLKADSQLAFEAFVSNPSRFEGKIMSELTYRVFLSLSIIKTISLGAIPGIGPLLINYSLSH